MIRKGRGFFYLFYLFLAINEEMAARFSLSKG